MRDDVASPGRGAAAVRRAHPHVEVDQPAAAARRHERHNVVAHGHAPGALSDARERGAQLGARLVVAEAEVRRARVAAEPQRPLVRVQQRAAVARHLGVQGRVEALNGAVLGPQAEAEARVQEEGAAGAAAAHRQPGMGVDDARPHLAVHRAEQLPPRVHAARARQLARLHIVRRALQVEQLVVAHEQDEFAAGGFGLFAERPKVVQQRQRAVAAVEHVARLHHSHRAADPLAGVHVDGAAQGEGPEGMVEVAVQVADCAHGGLVVVVPGRRASLLHDARGKQRIAGERHEQNEAARQRRGRQRRPRGAAISGVE